MAARVAGRLRDFWSSARLRRSSGLAALLVASWAAAAMAAGGTETLRDALAAAYRYNPRLDAERARLRATDEEVAKAQSGWRPVVTGSADAGAQRTSTRPATAGAGDTRPAGVGVSVSQPVFNGFRTTNAVREAEASVRAGRENLRLVESSTLLEAVTAFSDVIRDRALVRLRERNVEVLTQELTAAEARRSAREITKTDVAQARARRARALSAVDLAKANLRQSVAAFERVVGHAPGALREPALKVRQVPRSLDEALRIAEQESPNVVSALYREQAARHAVDKIWGELLPEVRVEAEYQHRNGLSRTIDEQDSASISGRVSIPLYQGGETQARVRQAKHSHVSRLQEIEQARSESQASAATAWARLMAARGQLKSDQAQVAAAEVALEGVREEQKVGQRTLLDVLNAEQELLDAQVQLVTTRRDIVVAAYSVLAVIGRLGAETLDLASEVYDPEANYRETRNRWFGVSIVHADGRLERLSAAGGDDPAGDDPE